MKSLYSFIDPPCDKIVANPRTASSQDESFSVRNSASIPAIMFKRKFEATWEERGEVCICFNTWHCLCSELCCGASAPQQHNRVWKRGRRPGRVSRSRHAVIVIDKDDLEALLFGTTSWCRGESSWFCLQPKRGKSRGCRVIHYIPHRRPACPRR